MELDDNLLQNDRKDALTIAVLTIRSFFALLFTEGVGRTARLYGHGCQQKRKLNAALNNLAAVLTNVFQIKRGI